MAAPTGMAACSGGDPGSDVRAPVPDRAGAPGHGPGLLPGRYRRSPRAEPRRHPARLHAHLAVAPDDGLAVVALTNGSSGAMRWLPSEMDRLLRPARRAEAIADGGSRAAPGRGRYLRYYVLPEPGDLRGRLAMAGGCRSSSETVVRCSGWMPVPALCRGLPLRSLRRSQCIPTGSIGVRFGRGEAALRRRSAIGSQFDAHRPRWPADHLRRAASRPKGPGADWTVWASRTDVAHEPRLAAGHRRVGHSGWSRPSSITAAASASMPPATSSRRGCVSCHGCARSSASLAAAVEARTGPMRRRSTSVATFASLPLEAPAGEPELLARRSSASARGARVGGTRCGACGS